MKYRILLLLLLAVSNTVSAQEADEPPGHRLFEGRIVTGLNFTQIMGDNHGGFHMVGANLGGMVYVHYKEVLGVSFEMLYTQKGVRSANVKESVTVGTYFDKYFLNLDYVEACLMLHLDCFILDYEAGISYARLVKSQEWAEADVPVVIDPSLATFNAHDFNYVAGLSYNINRHWAVNMRFQISTAPIRPRERVYPRYSDGSAGQFNQTASLRVLYTL